MALIIALMTAFYSLQPSLRAFARLALARYNLKCAAFKITFILTIYSDALSTV